jgi:hypothetical protein
LKLHDAQSCIAREFGCLPGAFYRTTWIGPTPRSHNPETLRCRSDSITSMVTRTIAEVPFRGSYQYSQSVDPVLNICRSKLSPHIMPPIILI